MFKYFDYFVCPLLSLSVRADIDIILVKPTSNNPLNSDDVVVELQNTGAQSRITESIDAEVTAISRQVSSTGGGGGGNPTGGTYSYAISIHFQQKT